MFVRFSASDRDRCRLIRARGFALITVLWIFVILSVIAAKNVGMVRTEARIAENVVDAAAAEALADAGVHRAIFGLLELDGDGGWRTDGTPYAWSFREGEIRVAAFDEGAKIDLNAASLDLLARLFVAVGRDGAEAARLAAAIADFRDRDGLRRLNGAEDAEYVGAERPYGAKDARFQSVLEVTQVLGMSAEIYRQIAGAVTVYSGRPVPHAPTAIPVVKKALSGHAGTSFALSDEGGVSAATAPTALSSQPRPMRRSPLFQPSGLRVYTIHAEARTAEGAIFVREAVVRIGQTSRKLYRILSWRQGMRTLFTETD